MSIKARQFFKNLKNILQKVEEKVQNNYKDQFTEPQNHYCLLESINLEFDGPWEEFDNFILDTHWRYGREFINDNGEKDGCVMMQKAKDSLLRPPLSACTPTGNRTRIKGLGNLRSIH